MNNGHVGRRSQGLNCSTVTALCLLSPYGKEKGRQHLRLLLGWEVFDEARDLRRSIELDALHDSLVFAAEKGLPWPAVAEVGKLTEELLTDTQGLCISEALQLLQDKLTVCEPKLSPFKACSVCDYFCNTFIRHYHLYQFVLCQERDLRQHLAHLEVCGPPQPLPLMAGTEVEAAKHQQQLAALSAAEAQKRTNMLLLQERLHLEKECMLQRVYDRVDAQAGALDRKVSAWGRPTQFRKETLEGGMRRIQTTFEILDLRLQKKTLSLNPPATHPPPPSSEDRAKSTKAQVQKKKK
uniref:Chromosome 8 open reading frame 74 n=1 Tax=Crocodylus porosus TaxID=8502 RepID=A0A7M4E275_CROPO